MEANTSESLEAYEYGRLPPGYIRLLYFISNPTRKKPNRPLIGSLRNVWLPTASVIFGPSREVRYEALSYAWGSTSETYPLLCDGRIIQVHRNLSKALPFIARGFTALPIWIDAICINQADEREKLEQIRLMSEIYRQAARVRVWLGIAEEPESTAMLDCIFNQMEKLYDWGEHSALLEKGSLRILGLPLWESTAWDAFHSMLDSTWFSRLWIVQELVLARKVRFQFGTHEIKQSDFSFMIRAIPWLDEIRDDEGKSWRFEAVSNYAAIKLFDCKNKYLEQTKYRQVQRDSQVGAMGFAFTGTVAQRCRDPKDRVLALLGLSAPEPIVTVDESTSVEDLYLQFVHFLLLPSSDKGETWQKIFRFATCQKRDDLRLPSWCPDLARCGSIAGADITSEARQLFKTSKLQPSIRPGEHMWELVVAGKIFDEILASGEVHRVQHPVDLKGFIEHVAHFYAWETEAMRLAQPLLEQTEKPHVAKDGNQFTMEDYWLTMVNERIYDSIPILEEFIHTRGELEWIGESIIDMGLDRLPYPEELLEEFSLPEDDRSEGFWMVEMLQNIFRDEYDFKQDRVPIRQAMDAIGEVHDGHRIIRTTGGRFGYANGNFQSGDRLVVFDGAWTPHIVRQVRKEPDAFELVGVAYVRGMMRGEVENLEIESQEIVLV